jgi:FKBP-type peptidyl-prolyl cis-trans isomerase FklB
MRKDLYRFLCIPAAGLFACGLALAQQSSAPSTQQPSAAKPSTTAPKKPAAGSTAAKPAVTLETQKQKASYAIGMNIGKNLGENLKKDAVDVDSEILLKGMKDALTGNKSLLTDEEIQAVLTNVQNDVRKHQLEAVAKKKEEGEAFLAANKAKPGVVTLPDGLQYKIITNGDGPKPSASDSVICNYVGTFIDGTEFDSTYKRGKPLTIPVGQVIKGWTEALELMPVGSKWEVYVPSNLAYGERGTPNGGPIGPNETLVFQLELLSIQPKPQPKLETVPPNGQPQVQPQAPPQSQQPQAQPQAQPQSQPQNPQPKP